MSQVVKRVSVALSAHLGEFVKIDYNNLDELKRDFYRINGFPNVIGCVDCTQIGIEHCYIATEKDGIPSMFRLCVMPREKL